MNKHWGGRVQFLKEITHFGGPKSQKIYNFLASQGRALTRVKWSHFTIFLNIGLK
jgi:hypothetical protein